MIVTEVIGKHPNGQPLIQRRSDRGVMLHKIGTEEYYSAPVDVANAPWSYEESEIPIEEEDLGPSDSNE